MGLFTLEQFLWKADMTERDHRETIVVMAEATMWSAKQQQTFRSCLPQTLRTWISPAINTALTQESPTAKQRRQLVTHHAESKPTPPQSQIPTSYQSSVTAVQVSSGTTHARVAVTKGKDNQPGSVIDFIKSNTITLTNSEKLLVGRVPA